MLILNKGGEKMLNVILSYCVKISDNKLGAVVYKHIETIITPQVGAYVFDPIWKDGERKIVAVYYDLEENVISVHMEIGSSSQSSEDHYHMASLHSWEQEFPVIN